MRVEMGGGTARWRIDMVESPMVLMCGVAGMTVVVAGLATSEQGCCWSTVNSSAMTMHCEMSTVPGTLDSSETNTMKKNKKVNED